MLETCLGMVRDIQKRSGIFSNVYFVQPYLNVCKDVSRLLGCLRCLAAFRNVYICFEMLKGI